MLEIVIGAIILAFLIGYLLGAITKYHIQAELVDALNRIVNCLRMEEHSPPDNARWGKGYISNHEKMVKEIDEQVKSIKLTQVDKDLTQVEGGWKE